MKRYASLLILVVLSATSAFAQSSPNFSRGQVPTAGQWNAAFATKQDRLTFTPLNQAGGTMVGKLQAAPATVNGAGFSLLPGIAPTSPSNGDLWSTGSAFFGRLNGQTQQLLGSGGTGDVSGMSGAPSGGLLRSFSERYDDCVNVRDRGAKADLVVDANNNYVSGTDNTAAFQAAINRAISLRRDVCIPGGSYYLASGVTADLSATTLDTGSRPSIRGVGRGTTWMRFGLGSFSAITYKGGATGAAPHVYATISGLRIDKVDVKGIGLDLQVAAFMSIEDVMVLGFDTGINGLDMLSSRFRHVTSTSNRIGANFVRGSFSYPNALSFIDSNISGNNETGIVAVNPTTLSIMGGEIAGNGLNSTSATRGGIYINGNPIEGGVGLVSDHVYYEGNAGLADVLIATGTATGTHTFRANTFNRTNGTNYVTNMIRVTGSASTMLDVRGNAFKRFNDYSANAARPYVDLSAAPNAVIDFSSTNLMDDPTIEGAALADWKSWTPTIGAASGTITASTVTGARYRKSGKTVSWEADFTITTNGSGAGALTMTLPVTPNPNLKHVFTGQSGTGAGIAGTSTSGTGTLIFNYAGGYPSADGVRILLSGTYEAQ